MRKEKEKELFQQFQKEQEKMADNLQSQRLQERSIEDEMVAKAMEEQYAKKEVANTMYILYLYTIVIVEPQIKGPSKI